MSAGKTTLAEALAKHFGGRLVPEVARSYLQVDQAYTAEDLLEIAQLQAAAEVAALDSEASLVVCDTDLLVIRVWWEEKFGELPEVLIRMLKGRTERAYLLVQPDLPWVADPLRENPGDRQRLFDIYESLLTAEEMPHRVVSGRGEQRLRAAIAAALELMPGLRASAEQRS